jgi:DNA-binding NarL/FixJ family response regulator
MAGVSGAVRVLVMDDDPLVRAGLSLMLDGANGIAVVAEAADGDEVPAAVDAHAPHVVLMDLGCRGWTASRRLTGSTAVPARRRSWC